MMTLARALSAGLAIIETTAIPLTLVRHDLPEIRFPHGKNHRQWKRLIKERQKHAKLITRRDAYVMGNKMFIHPDDARELRRQMQERVDRHVERVFMGEI